jgi:hypothetical protein
MRPNPSLLNPSSSYGGSVAVLSEGQVVFAASREGFYRLEKGCMEGGYMRVVRGRELKFRYASRL